MLILNSAMQWHSRVYVGCELLASVCVVIVGTFRSLRFVVGTPLKSCTHTGILIFPSVSGSSAVKRKPRKVPNAVWWDCRPVYNYSGSDICLPICISMFTCMLIMIFLGVNVVCGSWVFIQRTMSDQNRATWPRSMLTTERKIN